MTDDKIQMYIHEIDPVEDDHLESWTQNNDTPYALETIVSHGDVPTGRGGCSLSMVHSIKFHPDILCLNRFQKICCFLLEGRIEAHSTLMMCLSTILVGSIP